MAAGGAGMRLFRMIISIFFCDADCGFDWVFRGH